MELEWLLIAVVSMVVALAMVRRKQRRGKGVRAPGPRGLPIIGHLHLIGRLPHQDLFKLSQVHGPLMGLQLGLVPLTVASSPETARQILQTHDATFAGRPHSNARFFTSNGYRDIIFSNPSPYWRLIRQLCAVDLFSSKRVLYFSSVRSQEVGALTKSIYEDSVPSHSHILSSSPCLMHSKIYNTIYNTISRMVLGKVLLQIENTTIDQNRIVHLLSQSTHLGSQFNIGDYIPFLRWADFQGIDQKSKMVSKELYLALQGIIDQRRQDRASLCDSSPKDFLDILMDAATSSDEQINDEHIKAIIKDMYIAGIDTSTTTIEWTLAELLRNPSKMEAVQVEIERVVGKERKVQEADIENLPYLDACIKETMRLHPPGPLLVPHTSLESCQIDGFEVPARSLTFVNVWAIGRDPHVWHRPLEFCPERFLDTNFQYMQPNCFEFLPFGSGRRACPGWRLGLVTVQIILASLLHGFEWIPTKDLDLSESFNVILFMANPLNAFAIPKLPKHLY